jgi:branched-chain amino acid transport system ATP-binding protein
MSAAAEAAAPRIATTGTPLLATRGVETFYGNIMALRGVDLEVYEGEIVALIGANGAGKSTLMMTICGAQRARTGEVSFAGRAITRLPTHQIARLGIAQSPEGRRIFARMTVYENLQMGAAIDNFAHFDADLERVFAIFPRLSERRNQRGGTLSGGEQQMLAIARALMTRPRLLLLDEPSLGLAPMIIEEIFGVIRRLKDEQKLTVLLVEQNAALALEVADHAYVMENGRIVLEGPAESLRQNSDIKEFYLGLNETGARKSYHDAKHYKRRKRWLA